MRGTISILALIVLAALGCACSSQPVAHDSSGSNSTTTSRPSSARGAEQSPCPGKSDFGQALNDDEGAMAQAAGVTPTHFTVVVDSGIVCKDYIAAAWATVSPSIGGGRVVIVLRWRYWRLGEVEIPRTDADKRWEVSEYSPKFPADATVCEESPILQWLQNQGSCIN